jgi:hypothetical protein
MKERLRRSGVSRMSCIEGDLDVERPAYPSERYGYCGSAIVACAVHGRRTPPSGGGRCDGTKKHCNRTGDVHRMAASATET